MSVYQGQIDRQTDKRNIKAFVRLETGRQGEKEGAKRWEKKGDEMRVIVTIKGMLQLTY